MSPMSGQARRRRFLDPAVLERTAVIVSETATTAGVSHALVGGYAAQLFGSPRLTGDVDFVADGPLDAYESLGPLTFGGEKLVGPDGVKVDWIVRRDDYAALYAEALATATRSEIGVLVVTPEFQVVLKFAAGRPRDLGDASFLLASGAAVGEIVRTLIRRHLGGKFALDQFDAFAAEARWRHESGHGW